MSSGTFTKTITVRVMVPNARGRETYAVEDVEVDVEVPWTRYPPTHDDPGGLEVDGVRILNKSQAVAQCVEQLVDLAPDASFSTSCIAERLLDAVLDAIDDIDIEGGSDEHDE